MNLPTYRTTQRFRWLFVLSVTVCATMLRFVHGDEAVKSEQAPAVKNETPFQAGLRKFQLKYHPLSAGDATEERVRDIFLWYPTSEEAPRYDYRPLIGFAKVDAIVAPGQHPLILFSHGFLGAADQTIWV